MLYESEPSKPTRCCHGHFSFDPFPERVREEHFLHLSSYGEVEDMQGEAYTVHMYNTNGASACDLVSVRACARRVSNVILLISTLYIRTWVPMAGSETCTVHAVNFLVGVIVAVKLFHFSFHPWLLLGFRYNSSCLKLGWFPWWHPRTVFCVCVCQRECVSAKSKQHDTVVLKRSYAYVAHHGKLWHK